jgi:DNA-binding GntR family transcriptional regulator
MRDSVRPPVWRTKSEAAYHLVREQVMDGRLAPGTILDQEALAREMGLSTTPVREALRRLEAEGLVNQRAHFAIRIPELSRGEFSDIYAIRMLLDPEAARLACRSANAETCAYVASVLESASANEQHAATPLDRLTVNRDFHRAIYASSGNEPMTYILDSLWDRCDRYRLQLLKDEETTEIAHREHEEMLDAFCNKEEDRLADLVREHLLGSYKKLISLIAE